MIQLTIPKAPTDSPEMDLGTSSRRGEVETKGKLFDSILAIYLGELGAEENSNFGLEEAPCLVEKKDELKGKTLPVEQLALALTHLGLEVHQEQVEKGEIEREISISELPQGQWGVGEETPLSSAVFVPTPLESGEQVTEPVVVGKTEIMPDYKGAIELETTQTETKGLQEFQIEAPTTHLVELEYQTDTQHEVPQGFKPLESPIIAEFETDRKLVWEQFPPSLRASAQAKLRQALEQLTSEDTEVLVVESEVEKLLAASELTFLKENTIEPIAFQDQLVEARLEPLNNQPEQLVFGTRARPLISEKQSLEDVQVASSPQKESAPEVLPVKESSGESPEPLIEGQPSEPVVVEKPKRHEESLKNTVPLATGEMAAKSVHTEQGEFTHVQSKPVLDLQAQDTILPKITEQMQTLVQEERTEVRIQLKPEHLGEMKIKLSLERGIMVAEFVVENEAVREVIASQLPQLHTALQEQGANVGEMMVNLGFSQGKRDDETPARPRQIQLQARAQLQTGAVSQNQTTRLSKNPWYQVDLKA